MSKVLKAALVVVVFFAVLVGAYLLYCWYFEYKVTQQTKGLNQFVFEYVEAKFYSSNGAGMFIVSMDKEDVNFESVVSIDAQTYLNYANKNKMKWYGVTIIDDKQAAMDWKDNAANPEGLSDEQLRQRTIQLAGHIVASYDTSDWKLLAGKNYKFLDGKVIPYRHPFKLW